MPVEVGHAFARVQGDDHRPPHVGDVRRRLAAPDEQHRSKLISVRHEPPRQAIPQRQVEHHMAHTTSWRRWPNTEHAFAP